MPYKDKTREGGEGRFSATANDTRHCSNEKRGDRLGKTKSGKN